MPQFLKNLFSYFLAFVKDYFGYFLAFLIVFLLWGGGWYWIDTNVIGSSTNESSQLQGQFGDKFGAVNSLFAGLAFAGLILTILFQRRDINDTRNAMDQERFENTFFQLLRVHIDVTDKVEMLGNVGRKAFEAFNEHLKASDQDFSSFLALQKISRERVRHLADTKIVTKAIFPEFMDADVTTLTESLKSGTSCINNYLDDNEPLHREKIEKAYVKSAGQNIDFFSHYFRNLYHILKFLDEANEFSEDKKRMYSRFIRSQLSDPELLALFYNSLCPISLPGRDGLELGYPKMRKLLKNFDVLQNLNPRSIFHPIHRKFFSEEEK